MRNDIMQLLRWRRQAKSDTLKNFIKHYMGQWDLERDAYGNLYKRIGTAPIMWSCHLDTMHRKEGWQNVRIDELGIIRQKGNKSKCLGADDGAGVWLLLEMMDRGIEGLYIFHLDEEVGGKGSTYIVEKTPQLVSGIKYAVAFDRKDRGSVITNQWGVCCSDEFGESLAKEIGMGHILDDTGRFTDTDNYKGLIPECTNVSVGYFNEHRPQESLDFKYLVKLRDSMFDLDVNNLVEERTPTKYGYTSRRTSTYNTQSGYKSTSYGGVNYNYDRDPYDADYWRQYNKEQADRAIKREKDAKEERQASFELATVVKPGLGKIVPIVKSSDTTRTNIENLERLCSLNSRKLARIFLDMGASYTDVLSAFLNLDLDKENVATEDVNKDGWLSMIAKYVLGSK